MTSLFQVTTEDTFTLEDKNYLEELVGDNKKFKTPEELARGKAEADAYIKQLNTRADEMRAEMQRLKEENTTKAKLEDYIDQMKSLNNNTLSNTLTPVKEENVPLYDPKVVKDTIYQTYSEIRQKEREDENFKTIVGKLQERFGTNFQPHLKAKAMELGLDDNTVEQMARTMPQVLIRSLDLDAPIQREISPPRSSLRTDQFQPKGGTKRDYSFYQNMKKTQPELYNDPKTTVQRHKDVFEMGEKAYYGAAYDGE